MKSLAIVLSLAISTIVLPSGLTTASASKMNGKCCQSSDGGRSYRYRMAMQRAAIPHTCSAYAASCIRNSSARPDRVADVRRREIAMPAERGLCRPLQRQALRRNAEDVTASRNWSDLSCFRIPAFAMSILTGRELEFLASLNDSWARLYRNELARLLHKVDDRCDAHHETHSIIRISAARSWRSRRNSATTTKT